MALPRPGDYDHYFKAYSMAMLPGKERDNVSYGGKIIMPPSALAQITQMDLPSPWMFKLRNPKNPAASTHCGVLEFIADEGNVHLPHWMMKTLRLEEGDNIRVTNTELPKGTFVKLKPQETTFLEVSDPKAVLEQALRHFSAITQGDVISISYNSIILSFLVMETKPGGEGISLLDTDLEVDFEAPVGYVEPERPKPAAEPTMADKYKIDVNSSTPGSSRPGSSMAGTFAGTSARGAMVSKGGDHWESFKGKGVTLSGRKTKGKGVSHRPVEDVAEGSKIIRTDKHRIVTNDTLESNAPVPAALELPFGKLFFGYNIPPYVPPKKDSGGSESTSNTFSGSGNTLTGKSTGSSSKGKGKESSQPSSSVSWGSGGHKLGSRTIPSEDRARGAGGAPVPVIPRRNRPRTPSPEPEEDDDDQMEEDDDENLYYDSD
ncbi:ubiquitin fusion degradation protein UFD1-domain-containing protein [Abortiporus biennis]|nr:ubiquitin fusion degradation protein UFD1-domain-containing protein [Abortiporus biennis]